MGKDRRVGLEADERIVFGDVVVDDAADRHVFEPPAVRRNDCAELPVLTSLEHVEAGRPDLKAADMLGESKVDIEQLARVILRDGIGRVVVPNRTWR